ncbi:hypothetical protein DSO57_1007989 [Entomophthora muscae]|uniref:Uncharacterized protein n=1 Tax=Entomophthora muscae TaxID=34485 RepID=A0ACC2TI00_9FUNG|nr:hypothetical protein DSO57_1007989 [Entomophthora muscae]
MGGRHPWATAANYVVRMAPVIYWAFPSTKGSPGDNPGHDRKCCSLNSFHKIFVVFPVVVWVPGVFVFFLEIRGLPFFFWRSCVFCFALRLRWSTRWFLGNCAKAAYDFSLLVPLVCCVSPLCQWTLKRCLNLSTLYSPGLCAAPLTSIHAQMFLLAQSNPFLLNIPRCRPPALRAPCDSLSFPPPPV